MGKSNKIDHTLCPSSKCQDGAQLIGVVKQDGYIDMLHEPITVDKNFVDIAMQGRRPEMRFRFANRCIKGGCAQWTGERCGIIDKIIHHVNDALGNVKLPECSIRPQCRWFSQIGGDACKICPFVITDVTDMPGS